MPVELGQVWKLGRHRLMCGDATSREDVETLLDGLTADLTLTDPPYGVNVISKNVAQGTVASQKLTQQTKLDIPQSRLPKPRQYEPVIGDDNTDAARAHYDLAAEFSENQVIFGGNYFTDFLPVSKSWIVWDKQNGHNNNFADGELAWTSFTKVLKIYQWRWAGMIRKGKRDIELKERIHPTQKPVGLLKEILEDFTEENASVLDCFAGSGSTLIACEVSNRTCYAMELSPGYCEKIIGRWETLTGKEAELVSS